MSPQGAPLSYGADQLLASLEARLGPSRGANEWLDALLAEQRGAAAGATGGLDLERVEADVRDRLAQGETGAPLARAELASRAGVRAAEQRHDMATVDDVAYVLLEAVRATAAAAPRPVEAPGPAPEAVPQPLARVSAASLSFGAEELLASLLGGGVSRGLDELVVGLVQGHPGLAGPDAASVVATARGRLSSGDPGEPLGRDELTALAARQTANEGREVVTTADVAAAILGRAASSSLAAPPAAEPVTLPGSERAPEPEQVAEVEREAAPGRSRTFRVFVSSTFEDFKRERDVLRERVFPRLRQLCAERNARFQAIDLRWGVSEEASLDQQTVNICLGEIERCRSVTPRPNFLVLLGNHYGWLPPPPQIPADRFDEILRRVPADDRAFLERWYARDENARPAEYRLQPRTGERGDFADPRTWLPVETRLHDVLASAALGMALDRDERRPYVASATEQEIAAGALSVERPEDQVFCFFRELTDHAEVSDLGEGDPLTRFVDRDQGPLDALKAELRRCVPRGVWQYEVAWDHERAQPGTAHLERFADDVAAALEGAIRRELESPRAAAGRRAAGRPLAAAGALDEEGLAHRDFAAERTRFFVGRSDALGTVAGYLAGSEVVPLAVHGSGGTGKSAVIGEAVRRAQADHPAAEVVYRFIGATPASSDGRALLGGLSRELCRRYGADETGVPATYQELVADLPARLALATPGRPLYVFLDSLDQLSAGHGARSLAWLPPRLPANVRLVVSTRPGETLEPLERRGIPLVELGPISRESGSELLDLWLEDARRTLRPAQREAVLDAFVASGGNPLYLKLAFEEARRWSSGSVSPPERLATGIEAILTENLFARLAAEDSHGSVLVSHALGYLAASRYGLAEDELLELLSRDPDVYGWFIRGAYHVPPDLLACAERYPGRGGADAATWLGEISTDAARGDELNRFLAEVAAAPGAASLPVVLWSRLSFDLEPYLTERVAEGGVLMAFYHRELEAAAAAAFLTVEKRAELHGRLSDFFRSKADPLGDGSWGGADVRGLSELPYHLVSAGRDEALAQTLTDFRFLERKATDVGVLRQVDPEGRSTTTYTGVYRLLDDFDLALHGVGGGPERASGKRRLIVTAVDLGRGPAVRCPHCNTSSPHRDEWLGREIDCPSCGGPLRVNAFVVARQR